MRARSRWIARSLLDRGGDPPSGTDANAFLDAVADGH